MEEWDWALEAKAIHKIPLPKPIVTQYFIRRQFAGLPLLNASAYKDSLMGIRIFLGVEKMNHPMVLGTRLWATVWQSPV
jgi:hypothetical protein